MLCVLSAFSSFWTLRVLPVDMLLEVVKSVYRVCRVSSLAKIHVTFFLADSRMPINVTASRLRQEDCAASVEYVMRPRESRLENLDTDGIWDYMMRPSVDAQEATSGPRRGRTSSPLYPATTPSCCS